MLTDEAGKLAFDESLHRYTVGGKVLPSVTQVISSVIPGWQADEWYMQRGTAMHYGCQLLDEGRLDWSSVAPEIEGRLRAWEKFRKEFPAKVVACECRLADSIGFAGTLDRVFDDNGSGLIIADIKSSIAPQVKVQIGAYSQLWNDRPHARQVNRGVAVELRDNGTYSTMWMNRSEVQFGWRVFLACLTIHGFKTKERL